MLLPVSTRRRHAVWLLAVAVGLIRVTGAPADELDTVVSLLELVIDADVETARQCMSAVAEKLETGELTDENQRALHTRLDRLLAPILEDRDHPLARDAALLAAGWNLVARHSAYAMLESNRTADEIRLRAASALVGASEDRLTDCVERILLDPDSGSIEFRGQLVSSLGRYDRPALADTILRTYARLDPTLQPKAIELLTQRTVWSRALLAAIADGRIHASAVNRNQVARLATSRDKELARLVTATWGTVRTERNPAREQVIRDVTRLLARKTGNTHQGQLVFNRVCGQCHKIHGQGNEVGPDITVNGRASMEQLLSNVLDPSLVIGASYQARTLLTVDGRVLTGLLVEDSDQRVVLMMQGGKKEIIPRDDIEDFAVSKLSLMPESLETQLTEQELVDLFAFLALDKPPSAPDARRIPDTNPDKRPNP